MAKNQIFEVLAALGAGAVILSGCAGSAEPVKGTEVPAASAAPEAMPSGQPAAVDTGAAPKDTLASPTPSATPGASATPSATPSALPKAASMPKTNHTQKVSDSKRTKACESGCGEGTCGSDCPPKKK